jgi:threonine/homoserine/homoserine lactone efflux protein
VSSIPFLLVYFRALVPVSLPPLAAQQVLFLPQFIPAQADAPLVNMLVLGGVFMAMTLFVFMLYGLLANSVRTYIINSSKAMKYVQRTFAVTFAMLGTKLAFTER